MFSENQSDHTRSEDTFSRQNKMTDRIFKIGTTKLLDIHLWYSYVLGLWPRKNSTLFYIIYGYIFQILITFGWTLAKCIETALTQGKSEIIFLTATSLYCVVGTIRTFVILRRNQAIGVCIDAISEFPLNRVEREIAQPKIKAFAFWSGAYFSFICVAFLSTFILPIISPERALPVPIWLPLNWKENGRDFGIAVAYSMAGIFAVLNACGLSSILVWYLLYGCSVTLEVLGHRLKNVGHKENKQKENLNELVECIKIHQGIVE